MRRSMTSKAQPEVEVIPLVTREEVLELADAVSDLQERMARIEQQLFPPPGIRIV